MIMTDGCLEKISDGLDKMEKLEFIECLNYSLKKLHNLTPLKIHS